MIEFSRGRERPTNYVAICDNIADSYPDGISHGVQKDAIQNSIDARAGSAQVRVEFALIENDRGQFLTITDARTIGLTGPVLTDVEEYEDDLPPDYNWARFESFAFTKEDPDAIGARGQGKFIFLRASKEYTMFYDSLRGDGIYRLGATQATPTGCPILPPADEPAWEGETAAARLKEACGLDPLSEVGTRVVIVSPIEELCRELENGELSRYIHETWFRAIEKSRLEVFLSCGDERRSVRIGYPYPLPDADDDQYGVWVLGRDFEEDTLALKTGETYRVKQFHVVYHKSTPLAEELQGVAIVHNDMKITNLPASYLPEKIRKKVTGFIEFDRGLDRELRKRKNQHPNHYDLKWRRRIPQAIKAYVNNQLRDFGLEKLGVGTDPREVRRRNRSSAEEWAMRQLQRYAKDLDLYGARGGGVVRPPIHRPPPKDIGVSIRNFGYPDPEIAPRVNWGDTFEDLSVSAYNREDRALHASVLFQLLHGDSTVFSLVDHSEIRLGNEERSFGPFNVEVQEDRFPGPGLYRFKATLFDATTGDKLDGVARRFWVEEDPPLRKPFELIPHDGFPEPYEQRQWITRGTINSSPELWYNTAHPAYRVAEEDEDQQSEYLFEIVLQGALQFVLERPDLEDGTPDYHPLDGRRILGEGAPHDRGEIPPYAYDEVMGYMSRVRWRMLS